MSNSARSKSTLLAFADPCMFNILVKRINDQFEMSNLYKKSSNRIKIAASESISDSYHVQINTKYYNLELNLDLLPLNATTKSDLKFKLNTYATNKINMEGFLMLFDDKIKDLSAEFFFNLVKVSNYNNESTEQSNDEDTAEAADLKFNSRLNVFVLNRVENEEAKEIVENLFRKFQDHNEFIKVNLNLETENMPSSSRTNKQDEEEEEEFSELDELINGLFVHEWSNLELNEERKNVTEVEERAKEEEETAPPDEVANFGFENLLMNLKEMKDKADSLGFEERKKYAEQVVINFWKSIGGDMSELNGLDDEEDEE